MKIYTKIITKRIIAVLFIFAAFFVVLNTFPSNTFAQNTTAAPAQSGIRVVPITDGSVSANVIVDEQGKYRGMTDCRLQLDSGGQNGDQSAINQSACVGFLLKGMSVGDTYNNQTSISQVDRNRGTTSSISGVAFTCFSEGLITVTTTCYLQGDNGYVKTVPSDVKDKYQACLRAGTSAQSCTELTQYISTQANSIRSGTGPVSLLQNQVTQQQRTAKEDANKIAQELSTASNIVCRALLDNDSKPVYYCLKDGKPVGPKGETLSAECSAQAVDNKVLFRIDSSKNLTGCVTKTDSTSIIAKPANNEVQNQSKPEVNNDSSDNLGEFITNIAAKFILFLFWVFGSLLALILRLMMNVMGAFLRINPASSDFIGVAIRPWQIVVSIANLITLFSFLYTGFKYILGLKNKLPIGDFFLRIIVVVLTINFTIFAAAAVINITQGIGDTFVGAYSSVAEPGKGYGEVLFDNFVNGIKNVSQIRCNNAEPELGLSGDYCKDANGDLKQGLWRSLTKNELSDNVSAITGEVAYVLIIGWAIFVVWQALMIILIRVVALWMLMVTSPFALAAFFSPVPQLKKLADKWVQYFLNFTMIYPVIVLGFILVGALTAKFGEAVSANVVSGNGGIIVEAADEMNAFAKIFPLILVALVAIGALNLLVAFLKTFKTITDAIWDGAKMLGSGLAKTATFGARLGGAALGSVNAGKAKSIQDKISNLQNLKSQKDAELAEAGDNIELKKEIEEKYRSKGLKSDRQIENLKKRKEHYDNWKKTGDNLKFLPERIKGWKEYPKQLYSNFMTQQKAEREGTSAVYKMRRELAGRAAGYHIDGPDDLFPGVNQQQAQEMINDTKKMGQLENRFYTRAYQQVAANKSRLTKNQILDGLDTLPPVQKLGDFNDEQRKNFINFANRSSENEELLRHFANNPQLLNLMRESVDQGLLTEEAESAIRKKPVFLPTEQERYNEIENLSDADLAGLSDWQLGHEGMRARVDKLVREKGDAGAQELLSGKTDLTGGLTQTGRAWAEHDHKELIDRLPTQSKQRLENVSTQMVRKGMDENLIVQHVDDDGSNAGEVLDNAMVITFGGKSKNEVDSRLEGKSESEKLTYLESTQVGQLVMATDGYKDIRDPQEKYNLQYAAVVTNLENMKINKDAYSADIASKARVVKDQAKKYASATVAIKPGVKAVDEAIKIVTQKKADPGPQILDKYGNPMKTTLPANDTLVQTLIPAAAIDVTDDLKKQFDSGRVIIEGEERTIDLPVVTSKGMDKVKTAIDKAMTLIISGKQDQAHEILSDTRKTFDSRLAENPDAIQPVIDMLQPEYINSLVESARAKSQKMVEELESTQDPDIVVKRLEKRKAGLEERMKKAKDEAKSSAKGVTAYVSDPILSYYAKQAEEGKK